MSAPASDRDGITQTIAALIESGCCLDFVWDGEDDVEVSSPEEALDAIMAVDVATLWVTDNTGHQSFVYFVLGNDPDEVIRDHGIALSPILDPLTDGWWSE